MNTSQKLNQILAVVTRTEEKVEVVGKLTAQTFQVLTSVRQASEARPGKPPVVQALAAKAKAKPAPRKAQAKPEPQAKQAHTVTTTPDKLQLWYALSGGVREQVGMRSERLKDGRVRCVFSPKVGKNPTATTIAKAIAVVK